MVNEWQRTTTNTSNSCYCLTVNYKRSIDFQALKITLLGDLNSCA
ncbi:Uncharacterised protein [Klebsiella oxytoca]|nr:Uncharacterised protein [Klebsiella oxytoca]